MVKRGTAGKLNRWMIPALVNLCLAVVCTATFGAGALSARADTSVTDDKISDAADAGEWYQISDDGEVLLVTLGNHVRDYCWRYGSSNEKLRQLHDYEIRRVVFNTPEPDTWNLYLTPRDEEEGDVTVTFVYVRDAESDSIDTRTITVCIRDGKMTITDGKPTGPL